MPSLTVIDFVSLNSTQNLFVILDKKLDTVLEETCEVGGQDGEDGTSTRFNYKVLYYANENSFEPRISISRQGLIIN